MYRAFRVNPSIDSAFEAAYIAGTLETDPPEETKPEPAPAEKKDGADDPRVGELQNLVVHLKADFDNYRKRAQKELGAATRGGELDAIRKLLPAFANLERALAAAGADAGGGPLVDGIRQTHQQLQAILAAMGVERIPTQGVAFDPTLHDAVAATPRKDVPPGTVTDEFEPGYRADGRAIVPAKVRVSTAE